MTEQKSVFHRYRRVLSALGTLLIVVLIFWTVNSPAIVGVSASNRQLPVYCVQRDDRVVAMSFDAAWGNEDTQTLIDILNKYDINTTFFVVGDWVDKYPESVRALAENGNEIMNHSSTHSLLAAEPQRHHCRHNRLQREDLRVDRRHTHALPLPIRRIRRPCDKRREQHGHDGSAVGRRQS